MRKLARERGVDLAAITGSGGRGQITREDVEAALAGTVAKPEAAPVGGFTCAARARTASSPCAGCATGSRRP